MLISKVKKDSSAKPQNQRVKPKIAYNRPKSSMNYEENDSDDMVFGCMDTLSLK